MMKTCSRCGETKPLEEFRPYYNRSTGRYSFCKTCERIETRRKYLVKRATLTPAQQEELAKINALYAKRKAAGLSVPGTRASDVVNIVEQQLKETP